MSTFIFTFVLAFFWSCFLFWLFERIKRRQNEKRRRVEAERRKRDFKGMWKKLLSDAKEEPTPEVENQAIKQMAVSHVQMLDGLCRKIGWSCEEFMEELIADERRAFEALCEWADEYTEEKMIQKLREDLDRNDVEED